MFFTRLIFTKTYKIYIHNKSCTHHFGNGGRILGDLEWKVFEWSYTRAWSFNVNIVIVIYIMLCFNKEFEVDIEEMFLYNRQIFIFIQLANLKMRWVNKYLNPPTGCWWIRYTSWWFILPTWVQLVRILPYFPKHAVKFLPLILAHHFNNS